MKISFIAWIDYNRRSEILAQYFGASIHHISFGRRGVKWQIPIRYFVQSVRTLKALFSERPGVVFAQNPPIIILLPVAAYCFLTGSKYVIDSHTGVFTDFKKWLWLHKWLSKSKYALTTIVHNTEQEKIVQEWGVRNVVLGFSEATYPQGSDFPLKDGPTIAFSCACAPDEPMLEVFEAAKMLPHVNFYITGNYKRLDSSIMEQKPDNCEFTGFVSFDDYIGLMRKSDAMMVLTTRDGTLLSGGFEAASLEKPLIVSDWPILQDYFSSGSVYVDNKADGIVKGVQEALERQDELNVGIKQLRTKLNNEWAEAGAKVNALIHEFAESKQTTVTRQVYAETK